MTAEPPVEVEAAGGVVLRDGLSGPEVLLIHRPKYDDWTFPKGKLEAGEAVVDAALREVEEETGFTCVVDEALPDVRYRDHHDRPKRVRYWTMTATRGEFRPNHEVDEIRWVPLAAAAEALTYDHDRDVLKSV